MGKIIVPIETVVKFVSGGQMGVDRGALEAARIIAAQRRARKELKEKDPCIGRADFPQWFLERLKDGGVDLAERLSAKLSGVDEVAIERQTDSLFLIWNVTLVKVLQLSIASSISLSGTLGGMPSRLRLWDSFAFGGLRACSPR